MKAYPSFIEEWVGATDDKVDTVIDQDSIINEAKEGPYQREVEEVYGLGTTRVVDVTCTALEGCMATTTSAFYVYDCMELMGAYISWVSTSLASTNKIEELVGFNCLIAQFLLLEIIAHSC